MSNQNSPEKIKDTGFWVVQNLAHTSVDTGFQQNRSAPDFIYNICDYITNIQTNIHERAIYLSRKTVNCAKKNEDIPVEYLFYSYHTNIPSSSDMAEFRKLAAQALYAPDGPIAKILKNALAGGYLVESFVIDNSEYEQSQEIDISPRISSSDSIKLPESATQRSAYANTRPRFVIRLTIPTTMEEYTAFKNILKQRLQAMGVDVDETVAS